MAAYKAPRTDPVRKAAVSIATPLVNCAEMIKTVEYKMS